MDEKFGVYCVRNFLDTDAVSLARYADNRRIWENLRDAFPYPYTLHDAETFIDRVNSVSPTTVFAIASETEAIGSIGLMPGSDVHQYTAELGYWLAEPFWGKGIITQAVNIVTEYAFNELKLHRVYAEPYTKNKPSVRVLEKAGFFCEGVLRKNVFKDGEILDQYMYSRVKE